MGRNSAAALAEKVKEMQGSDVLRLAAALLDSGDWKTATILVNRVSDDLQLMKIMAK